MTIKHPWMRLPFYSPEGEGEGGEGAGEGEGAGAGGEGGEGAGEGGEGAGSWLDSITDPEERKHAERYTDPAAMNRAQMELRQKNSGMINVPGNDADDETVAKFRKAIGADANPETYTKDMDWSAYGEDYEPTEGQVAELSAFAAIAAEEGIPVSSFGSFAKAFTKMQAEQVAALKEENSQAQQEITAELKQTWGEDYERNMTLKDVGVARVAKAMGVDLDEFKKVLNAPIQHTSVQIGNTPAVVKLMVMAAKMLSEDTPADMGDVTGRVETLEKERDDIEQKITDGKPLTQAERKRRIEIYELLDQFKGDKAA